MSHMAHSSIKNVADRLKMVVAPPTGLQAVRSGSTRGILEVSAHSQPSRALRSFHCAGCVTALVPEKGWPLPATVENGALISVYRPRAISHGARRLRGQVAALLEIVCSGSAAANYRRPDDELPP